MPTAIAETQADPIASPPAKAEKPSLFDGITGGNVTPAVTRDVLVAIDSLPDVKVHVTDSFVQSFERLAAVAGDGVAAAGQLHPIHVCYVTTTTSNGIPLGPDTSKGSKYKILAGRRRLAAMRKLSREYIRADVWTVDPTTNFPALLTLIENEQRGPNLHAEYRAYKSLVKEGADYAAIHEATGAAIPTIKRVLRLDALTPVLRDLLWANKIRAGVAYQLVTLGPAYQLKAHQMFDANGGRLTSADVAQLRHVAATDGLGEIGAPALQAMLATPHPVLAAPAPATESAEEVLSHSDLDAVSQGAAFDPATVDLSDHEAEQWPGWIADVKLSGQAYNVLKLFRRAMYRLVGPYQTFKVEDDVLSVTDENGVVWVLRLELDPLVTTSSAPQALAVAQAAAQAQKLAVHLALETPAADDSLGTFSLDESSAPTNHVDPPTATTKLTHKAKALGTTAFAVTAGSSGSIKAAPKAKKPTTKAKVAA